MQLRVLSLIALLAACGSDDAANARRFELRVYGVDARPVDGEIPDEEAVRQRIQEAVRISKAFVDPRHLDAPVLATRIGVGEVASAAGSRVLRVEVDATVPDELHATLGTAVDATIELERVDGRIVPAEDVPEALGRAVAVLDAKLSLVTGDESDARRLLGDPDPEIVVLALEHTQRQRWRQLADDVAAVLPGTDPRVTIAAVGCLGEIGRPEHARAMLEHVRLADTAQAQRLYEALAAVGGDEAAAFLEFAARNEDDPTMADVAERALRRLQTRPEVADVDPTLRGHRP
ncbi:MAG TPA: HEAT repeat domain-containing protein [Nannocystaceae bacterium]|nr:HEAT repeat domain-containing protein [Nannocystaceae bacterium]